MAKKSVPTTTKEKSPREKQLDRLLKNLRENADAGNIEAIVVSVALKPNATYPNDERPGANAGGYSAAVDIGCGVEEDDDMVTMQSTVMTRGLAVIVDQQLLQKPSGLFG